MMVTLMLPAMSQLHTVGLHQVIVSAYRVALRYFSHLYVLSTTVLTQWVAPPKMFCNW